MRHRVTTSSPTAASTIVQHGSVYATPSGHATVRIADDALSPWRDVRVRDLPPELGDRARAALCCGSRILVSQATAGGWTREGALNITRVEPGPPPHREVRGVSHFSKLYRILLKHVLGLAYPDDIARAHYDALGLAMRDGERLPPWLGAWPSWDHLVSRLELIAAPGLATIRRSALATPRGDYRVPADVARTFDRTRLNPIEAIRALEVLGRLAETWRFVMFATTVRALSDEPTHVHNAGGEVSAWRAPGPVWIPFIQTNTHDRAATSITPNLGSRVEDLQGHQSRFVRGRLANAVTRTTRAKPNTSAPMIHHWLHRLET